MWPRGIVVLVNLLRHAVRYKNHSSYNATVRLLNQSTQHATLKESNSLLKDIRHFAMRLFFQIIFQKAAACHLQYTNFSQKLQKLATHWAMKQMSNRAALLLANTSKGDIIDGNSELLAPRAKIIFPQKCHPRSGLYLRGYQTRHMGLPDTSHETTRHITYEATWYVSWGYQTRHFLYVSWCKPSSEQNFFAFEIWINSITYFSDENHAVKVTYRILQLALLYKSQKHHQTKRTTFIQFLCSRLLFTASLL